MRRALPLLVSVLAMACGKGQQFSPEVACNNIDDDGDRVIDEGFELGGACEGVGLCGLGRVECGDDEVSVRCSSNPGGSTDESTPEACDDLDHDCDGDPLNGLTLGSSCTGVGACGTGVAECNDAGMLVCSVDPGGSASNAMAETCDGTDEDCDGNIDEDFMVGEACDGEGACGAGTMECATLMMARCSTEPEGSADESTAETCEGTDQDCDGVVDEDFSVGIACDGVGECGAGLVECADADTTRCSTDPGGSMEAGSGELCDGVDNDCDGNTDEAFPLGDPCTGTGSCGDGIIECTAGDLMATQCSTDPGGSDFVARPEVCDGADNDCSGEADDGDPAALCASDPVGGFCVDGACECPAGTFDIDREVPGCECNAMPAATAGLGCGADSIDLGDLSDVGAEMTVRGNVLPADRVVWYRFRAVDSPDTACDNHHVRVLLSDNPGDAFEFTTFRGGCGTPMTADSGFTDETWRTDFRATIDGRLAGQCPCGTRMRNISPCSNNTMEYFVRVRRRSGAAAASCATYEIEFSNGIYNTP
ncbi:MAG: MopE-related protein [Myxococcota bacterium]